MRYSLISAAIAALVSSVAAQTSGFDAITSPTQDQNIQAGSSFDIIWEPNGVTGTITISLLQGATFNTLQVGPVVAASIDNTLGTYTYTIPSTSSFATYGFQIVLDSTANGATRTFQYSKPFHIVGGSSASASGSSASATGSGSTTTVHLSTNPSYTSSSTVSVTTSTSVSSIASTTTVVTASSSSTTSSGSLTSVSTETSTTLKTTSTKTSGSTSSGSSSTSSASPVSSSNAAMSNVANGGLAMVGGIVLALAL